MIFLNNVNLNQNEVQNAVLHPLATPPANPVEFQIYTNSVTGKIMQYVKGEWHAVGAVVENSATNGKILVDGKEIEVYSLPSATAEALGGVKPDAGFAVSKDGTLSKKVQYFTTERAEGATDDEAITAAVGEGTPNEGDYCVIKTLIADGKYSYTAFVYEEGTWKAMDGNVNAKNVYLSRDITITAPIGVHTIPASGSKTLAGTGKNIEQFFEYLGAEEKNPTTTQPSITVNGFAAKGYEVGTTVSPKYSAVLDPGKYSYGPATGVTAQTWTAVDTEGNTKDTAAGQFDDIVVGDGTNYKVTVTCVHTDGVVPKTNLDNPYPAGKILGGESTKKSKVTGGITGFRAYFYGSKTAKDAVIDSAFIRGLTNSGKAATASSFNMAIPDGAMRVVIALPTASGRTLSKVEDQNAFGTDVVGSFVKTTVQVEGANGYQAVSYDVYTFDSGKALSENTYKVTIA